MSTLQTPLFTLSNINNNSIHPENTNPLGNLAFSKTPSSHQPIYPPNVPRTQQQRIPILFIPFIPKRERDSELFAHVSEKTPCWLSAFSLFCQLFQFTHSSHSDKICHTHHTHLLLPFIPNYVILLLIESLHSSEGESVIYSHHQLYPIQINSSFPFIPIDLQSVAMNSQSNKHLTSPLLHSASPRISRFIYVIDIIPHHRYQNPRYDHYSQSII